MRKSWWLTWKKININDLSSVEEEYINDPFQVSDDDEDEQNDNSADRSNDAIFNLMSFSDSRVKIQDLVKKATRTPPRNRDTRISPRSQNVKQLNSAVRTLNTLLDDMHNDAFNSEGSWKAYTPAKELSRKRKMPIALHYLLAPHSNDSMSMNKGQLQGSKVDFQYDQ